MFGVPRRRRSRRFVPAPVFPSPVVFAVPRLRRLRLFVPEPVRRRRSRLFVPAPPPLVVLAVPSEPHPLVVLAVPRLPHPLPFVPAPVELPLVVLPPHVVFPRVQRVSGLS